MSYFSLNNAFPWPNRSLQLPTAAPFPQRVRMKLNETQQMQLVFEAAKTCPQLPEETGNEKSKQIHVHVIVQLEAGHGATCVTPLFQLRLAC